MLMNFSKHPKYEIHKNSINVSRFVSCGKTETDRHDKSNNSYSHFFGNLRKKVSLVNRMVWLALDSPSRYSDKLMGYCAHGKEPSGLIYVKYEEFLIYLLNLQFLKKKKKPSPSCSSLHLLYMGMLKRPKFRQSRFRHRLTNCVY